jgi:hypothetical protein
VAIGEEGYEPFFCEPRNCEGLKKAEAAFRKGGNMTSLNEESPGAVTPELSIFTQNHVEKV